jgi:hypothetical protein
MGRLEDGKTELVSILDGYWESKQSWQEMLRDLKQRKLLILKFPINPLLDLCQWIEISRLSKEHVIRGEFSAVI